jgi:hypothetical protein
LGITSLAAYSVGRQEAPANHSPATTAAIAPSTTAQPVAALVTPAVKQAAPVPQSTPAPQQKPASTDVPTKPESKQKVGELLTAAAIAAIIVQASRNEYYATGQPCACPNDRASNGSAWALAALTPDRAVQRRFAIRATLRRSNRQRQASR